MKGWDKITLYKFQQINKLSENKAMSDIDKTLFSVCMVFDYTEYELDNLPLKKVNKLTAKVSKIFESKFNPVVKKRIGKYFINYNPDKLTFGQYIELAFFLSSLPVQNAHYILASVSNTLFRKNNSADHKKKAEYFLHQPVKKVLGSLNLLIERVTAFNDEYKVLFGLDKVVSGEAEKDPFNKRYGWIYSASQVAEYERITLEQAFQLPVRQAFNDLAYLKAKSKYEIEQLNKK